MTTQPEALRLAESLEADFRSDTYSFDDMIQAAAELRRLYAEVDSLSYRLAYPDNFAREWVGLTDEEIEQEFGFIDEMLRACVYRTEAKLKEKNT
jgi:hypothetical protein